MKLTEKKKGKLSLLKKLASFVEAHFWHILIVIATVTVLAPILVWLCYGTEKPIIRTEISADGMLGYLGSIIGGAVSMMVAIVALYQAEKIHERDVDRAIDEHLNEIRPNLYLEMEKKDDCMEVKISNCGKFRAIGVYLFAYDFAPLIEPDKRVKRRVEFRDESEKGYLTVDTSFYEVDENGYPEKVTLYYKDVDRNLYVQSFRLTEGNCYDPGSPELEEYMGTCE